MGMFVANKVIKLMIKKGHKIEGSEAIILGITFKENCPDIRNSRVIDIYHELQQFGVKVDVYDPHADSIDVKKEYGINLIEDISKKKYHAVILAVSHDLFLELDYKMLRNGQNAIIFDIKSFLDRNLVDSRL